MLTSSRHPRKAREKYPADEVEAAGSSSTVFAVNFVNKNELRKTF